MSFVNVCVFYIRERRANPGPLCQGASGSNPELVDVVSAGKGAASRAVGPAAGCDQARGKRSARTERISKVVEQKDFHSRTRVKTAPGPVHQTQDHPRRSLPEPPEHGTTVSKV